MKTYLFLNNSTISILFWLLFLHVIAVFLESDVFVELLGTFIAFRDQMQTHTSDMFLGAEVLEVIHLLTLDLQFQQTDILQSSTPALMVIPLVASSAI